MLKPFMLLLHVTVLAPDTGGIATSLDRIYTPSEAACKATATQLTRRLNWVRQKKDTKGNITHTLAYSIAKAICVPMRGVQHMPGRK
mgnify:FL=1|jgi:hypothetical protein